MAPETLYIVFLVAKCNVEVWLHMGLGIMPKGWSYELFWEFLDMQKGAGCNSVTLSNRASYWRFSVVGGKVSE